LGAKLKLATALLLVAGLVAGGAGLAARQGPANSVGDDKEGAPKSAKAARPSSNADKPTHTDRYGDPLPEGAIQRLGTLRFRHGGGTINALLVSPDGKTLVSHTYYGSRTACVWDLASGKLLHQFPGHYEENRAVALSPDGKMLAIGHDD